MRVFLCLLGLSFLLLGCTPSTKMKSLSGLQTQYHDVGSSGPVKGVGIESQDIVSVTDIMLRDMLANPTLAGREIPPRVIIDDVYFRNESTTRINKKLITDRLRVQLNRAAMGRMVFVGRHYSQMVAKEREMKRDGAVDGGTIRKTKATAGADFRLGGTISSLDMRTDSGVISRYHQIIFEMIDLEYGTIVWSNMYEFKKTGQDDVSYR